MSPGGLSFTKDEDYYLSQLERFFVPKPFISKGKRLLSTNLTGKLTPMSLQAHGGALLFVQFRLTALQKKKVDLAVESIEPFFIRAGAGVAKSNQPHTHLGDAAPGWGERCFVCLLFGFVGI